MYHYILLVFCLLNKILFKTFYFYILKIYNYLDISPVKMYKSILIRSYTLITIHNESIYTTKQAAEFFGVSNATILNWIKTSHLVVHDKKIFGSEILSLHDKISSGEIQKLKKRANKSGNKRTFSPDEYIHEKKHTKSFKQILTGIEKNTQNVELTIKFLLINYLEKNGLLVINEGSYSTNKKSIIDEIASWNIDISDVNHHYLLDITLPDHHDPVGFIYQSLFSEGSKSKQGSYYTPLAIVQNMIKDSLHSTDKALDPCCGTGQFLLAFADTITDPENIYGYDIDPVAVLIARINIIVRFKEHDFSPHIFCINSLCDLNSGTFDFIATNPPWGSHFTKNECKKLKSHYPMILSGESFSYFLVLCLSLLKENGFVSLILPESFLHVKTHKDIRDFIIDDYSIHQIHDLGTVFKNVFTPVIRIDIQKKKEADNCVTVLDGESRFSTRQSDWKNSDQTIFSIHITNDDKKIIDSVYSLKHLTLAHNAHWALGIVTGNNRDFIRKEPFPGSEPIYTGKEISHYYLNDPVNFIRFTPEIFQQVAPVSLYRSAEKIVYRFISKDLVFAYDSNQVLPLNSANCIIPHLNYPIKVIVGLFNSSLYNFLFKKQFSSIKVLRNHIETLPLPLLSSEQYTAISSLVNELIENKKNDDGTLDEFIFDCFGITENNREICRKLNR